MISISGDIPQRQQSSVRVFEDKFSASLRDLRKAGKQAYIWEPLPGSKGSAPQTLARIAAGYGKPSGELRTDDYFETFRFFFDTLSKNQNLIAGRFSPSEVLCKTATCAISIDGRPLYFDDNHLSRSSSHF